MKQLTWKCQTGLHSIMTTDHLYSTKKHRCMVGQKGRG